MFRIFIDYVRRIYPVYNRFFELYICVYYRIAVYKGIISFNIYLFVSCGNQCCSHQNSQKSRQEAARYVYPHLKHIFRYSFANADDDFRAQIFDIGTPIMGRLLY